MRVFRVGERYLEAPDGASDRNGYPTSGKRRAKTAPDAAGRDSSSPP